MTKITHEMGFPPFPEGVKIEQKLNMNSVVVNGIMVGIDFDYSSKPRCQFRLIDLANGVKTGWTPLLRPHKAIWHLWGQYCLAIRRNVNGAPKLDS